MKVITLYGSPRKNGNSATLVKYFLEGLESKTNFNIKHFFTNEMNIKHCQGCESCSNTKNNECIIDDDMHEIYSSFAEADIIIWASSMFWGYLTSQLKTALDRLEALAMNPDKNFKGKTFVVILTYRYHYETAEAFFKRIAPIYDIKLHILTYCSLNEEGSKDVHVLNSKEKLKQAFELGELVGRSF